jgi:hypothetical protein
MRTPCHAVLLTLVMVCLAMPLATYSDTAPLSNADIERMVQLKSTPGDIITLIERNVGNTNFTFTADGLTAL